MLWSENLAYAIGLIATDGSLSNDGRHLNFTSKDIDQIQTFAKIRKRIKNFKSLDIILRNAEVGKLADPQP